MLECLTKADVRDMRVRLALGEVVAAPCCRTDGFALGVFVNACEAGIVRGVEGLEWVRAQPEFVFDTVYVRRGQVIPPRGASKRGREAWLYGYDAFYWCDDTDRIDDLHRETLRRVRVQCEDAIASSRSGAGRTD